MTVRLAMSAKKAPTDASDSRLDFRNGFVRNSDNTLRTGITAPVAAGLQLVTATADTGPMTVSVAALDAVANRDGGVVQLCNDGIVKPTIAPAPASGQRLDVVYVMQHDSSSGVVTPDADDLAGVYVATGTAVPSGQPGKPSIPAAATELATVYMPAGVTSTLGVGVVITQTFQYTAAAGGVVPFPTLAGLQAWTTARGGQLAHALDTDQLYLESLASTTPGWKLIGGKPIIGAFTPQGIYTNGGGSAQAYQQSDHVGLEGVVGSSSANFLTGQVYTLGSIPATLAPTTNKTFACLSNISATAWVTVASTGVITLSLGVAFTGALNLSLENCQWRAKGYAA